MIHYAENDFSNLQSGALVVEVDCVNGFNHQDQHKIQQSLSDVFLAFRKTFDEGRIEPGRLVSVVREGLSPNRVFFFPTRVHPHGKARTEYVASGLDQLVEQSLQLGIKSLSIAPFKTNSGDSTDSFKLELLSAFARVPEIDLILLSKFESAPSTQHVTIFTDGGAHPNSGGGGYGVVLRHGGSSRELSCGFKATTSNRMELLAAIEGLAVLKHPCRVRLHSDSRYLIDYVQQGQLLRLAGRNWINKRKASNVDLWKRFLDGYLKHEVELVWVKGHSGIADNERCDELATAAIQSGNLLVDPGYKVAASATKVASNVPSSPKAIAKNKVVASSSIPPPAINQQTGKVTGSSRERPRKVGDPCRNCKTPVIRRKTKKHSPKAAYWYEWYLYCEGCKRIYHVDEAKVYPT